MNQRIFNCTAGRVSLLQLILFVACTFLMPVLAQEQAPKAKLEKVPVREGGEVSGSQLFHSYCASCHGRDGKGNGPAAAALKTAPADLTLVSKKNGDKFPTNHVMSLLANESDFPVHGSKDMPIWGPVFRRMGADRNLGRLRGRNLTEYLRSIQQK